MAGTARLQTGFLQPDNPGDLGWVLVGTGDLNGDGKQDLVWQHLRGPNALGIVGVWYMDQTNRVSATFTAPEVALGPDGQPDTAWRIKAVADFNGDGKPDFLWQHEELGDQAIWFMNDNIRISAQYLSPQVPNGSGWEIVAAGDFNRDGKADIVWQNRLGTTPTGDVAIWYQDGVNRIASTLTWPNAVNDMGWRIRGLADFNGDQRPDLVWQHTDDWLGVWFMSNASLLNSVLLSPARVGDSGWTLVGPTEMSPTPVVPPSGIWNLQITPYGGRLKSGLAATGKTGTDKWNTLYVPSDVGWASVSSTRWSDNAAAPMYSYLAYGTAGSESIVADPLMAGSAWPVWYSSSMQLSCHGVPSGMYDIYVYMRNTLRAPQNVTITDSTEASGNPQTISIQGSSEYDPTSQVWVEGIQYAVLRNRFLPYESSYIRVTTSGALNGIQLVLKAQPSPNDTDADELPDTWENQYFGNLNQNPVGDPDGDGLLNIQELISGTHPLVNDDPNTAQCVEIDKALMSAFASSVQWTPPSVVLNGVVDSQAWDVPLNDGAVGGYPWLRIDLGASQLVGRVRYMPPGYSSYASTGALTQFRVYVTDSVSNDPANWGTPVIEGNWTWSNGLPKLLEFSPKRGRYVYIQCINGLNGRVGARELWIYRKLDDAPGSPTITPNGGTFTGSQAVSLSSATPGSTIYFTIDGSTPTTNSIQYHNTALILTNSTILKAIAWKAGSPLSAMTASQPFVINPEFNLNWALDEGSGTIAMEASSDHRQGVLQGPVWATARVGSGLSFTSNGQQVAIASPGPMTNSLRDLSLSLWMRPVAVPSASPALVVGKSSGGYGIQHQTDGRIAFFIGHPTNCVSSPIALNTWTHVTGTFRDGNELRLYLNGVCVSTNTGSSFALTGTAGSFTFGAANGTFRGTIDEVAFKGFLLNSQEVLEAVPDADLLANSWEIQFFGNLEQGNEGDPDLDGYSNTQEFVLGSNPNQADLRIRIGRPSRSGPLR